MLAGLSLAGAMSNAAAEQGAAEDLGSGGECRGESGAGFDNRLLLHLYE